MFDIVETYNFNSDLSNTCRLCLTKDVVMTDIYSYDTEISLPDKIQSLASVTISPNDGLPALICEECCRNIEHYAEFRKKIEFSYRYLSNFVNQDPGVKSNTKSVSLLKPLATASEGQAQYEECTAVNFTNKICDPHVQEKCKSKNELISKKDIFDDLSSSANINFVSENSKIVTDKLPLDFYTDNYLIGPYKEYETSSDEVSENFIINESNVLCNIFNCNDNVADTDGLDYPNKLLKDDCALNGKIQKQIKCFAGTSLVESDETDRNHDLKETVASSNSENNEVLNTELSDKIPSIIQHELRQSQANLIRRITFLEKSIQINEQEEIMPRITKIETDNSNSENDSIEFKNTYFCHICLEEFTSYDIAIFFNHSVLHFGDVALNQISSPFDCELCSKQYLSRYDFVLHQRMHCNVEPFNCVDCKQKFLNLEFLNEHKKKIIPCSRSGRIYICDYCGKRFKRKNDLTYHSQTHFIKKKTFQCDLCNTLVSNKKTLDIHRRRHFESKRFSCEKCEKSFHLRNELMRHEQLHTGKRKFPCPLCEKAFMSKAELKRHSVYHSKERLFKCDLCDKRFYESSHLTGHRNTHNKINSFVCEICGDSFPSACKFKKHSKIHSERKRRKISSNDDPDDRFQIVTLPAGVTALEGLSMKLVESSGDNGLIIIAEGTEEAMNEITYLIVDN